MIIELKEKFSGVSAESFSIRKKLNLFADKWNESLKSNKHFKKVAKCKYNIPGTFQLFLPNFKLGYRARNPALKLINCDIVKL